MKDKPLISVVVPCYNAAKYIQKTLDSILNQSINDIELIVVDDGSKDDTIKVVEGILEGSKIMYRVISKDNGGVSSARNVGLKNSQGRYIYFLDSDDYIEDNMMELMTKQLDDYNADIVFCGYDYVNEDGTSYKHYDKEYNYIMKCLSGVEAFKEILNSNIHIWTGSVVYKRELLLKNNIEYYEGCNYGEDYEFICKCICKSERVISVNKILAHYVQRDTSLVHNFNLNNFKSFGAMKRVKVFAQENGLSESIIRDCEDNYNREALVLYNKYLVYSEKNKEIDDIFIKINNKFRKKLRKYRLTSFSKEKIKKYILVKMYSYNLSLYTKFMKKKHGV